MAYRDDYDFGVGADMASGSPMGLVVDGSNPTGVGHAGGATVIFEVRSIEAGPDGSLSWRLIASPSDVVLKCE